MTSRLVQASLFALSTAAELSKDSGICSIVSARKTKVSGNVKMTFYEVCIKISTDKTHAHKSFCVFRKNQKWNLD